MKHNLSWETMASANIYRIDEDLFTLDQLRDANPNDPDLLHDLANMAVGEISTIGGGASAEFTVERLI